MRSSARREGDVYVLNGEKAWVSFCDYADYFLVFAYTDREKSHNGISAFMVERESKGFTTSGYHDKLGLRAGNTGRPGLRRRRDPGRQPHRRRGRRLQGGDELS